MTGFLVQRFLGWIVLLTLGGIVIGYVGSYIMVRVSELMGVATMIVLTVWLYWRMFLKAVGVGQSVATLDATRDRAIDSLRELSSDVRAVQAAELVRHERPRDN